MATVLNASLDLHYHALRTVEAKRPHVKCMDKKQMIVTTESFMLWEKMEPKLRKVHHTSSKIRSFEFDLFVAKCQRRCVLTKLNFQQKKFLPLQDITCPHFRTFKAIAPHEVLLSWLFRGLSCHFSGSCIFVLFFSIERWDVHGRPMLVLTIT